MPCKEVLVDKRSKLAVITLNRPEKKNAISREMYAELTRVLNEISDDDNISITVLTGNGDFYSSGTDLVLNNITSFDKFITETSTMVREFLNAMINHNKILVALVNGPAIGIAVTTLALCDIVYCTDNTTFQTPFTRLGLSAEGCSSFTFPLIMGFAKAGEMLFFNYKMTAQEALKIGFVAQVYSKSYLQTKLLSELEKNANELPRKSLIYSKELIRHFYKDKLLMANKIECDRLEERWMSEEFMEAVTRFRSRSKL